MFQCKNQEFLNPTKPFSIPRRNKYFWFNFYHFSNTSDYGKVNCSWLQINPIFNGFRSSPSTVFRKIYFYPGCWGMAGGRRYFWNFYGFFPFCWRFYGFFTSNVQQSLFCCCNVQRKVSNQLSSFVGKKMFNMHGLINDKAIKSFFHLLYEKPRTLFFCQ